MYQMNVVAAYHTQKHLVLAFFLCAVLLAPGIRKIVQMIHQDPCSAVPVSVISLLGGVSGLWFFFFFLCFGAF